MAFVLGRMPLMMSDRNLSLFVIKLLLIGINAVNSPFLGMQLQKYDFYLFQPNKSLFFLSIKGLEWNFSTDWLRLAAFDCPICHAPTAAVKGR